ncbi:MAG: hypothetical protein ABJN04_01995 [Hyphomicrobiales bacterium]
MRWSFVLLVTVSLAACSNNGELQTEDILEQSLKIERTFSWTGIGFSGEVTLRPDTTASLSVTGKGADDGRWQVQGDSICTTWKKAAQGKTKCAKIYRQFDGSYKIVSKSTGVTVGLMNLKTDKKQ